MISCTLLYQGGIRLMYHEKEAGADVIPELPSWGSLSVEIQNTE
jgi:hypothetical protein